MSLNADDVLRLAQELDIQFVRLQFVDLLGVLKNVSITVDQLERAIEGRIMFDGSSVEGFARIEESDMYLRPDPATFTVFPWRPRAGGVARLICDIVLPDGSPFPGCSRQVLKNVLARAEKMDYTVQVGPEIEFFLFHYDENNSNTLQTHDCAGYFDLAPSDLGEDARREVVITLKEMGYSVEASHHEEAPGQHEVDLKYVPALAAADLITTFRTVVKVIAFRHGLKATFMPKPFTNQSGSGMHLNFSFFRQEENLFYDSEEPMKLTPLSLSFIGGILERAREFTALTNPTVNSYKRLVPGHEAPVYVAWSKGNRSSLVRVPVARGIDTRVELRSPDPTCNPYLALAAIIEAGLEGISRKSAAPPLIDENLYLLSPEERRKLNIKTLPRTLGQAMEIFKESAFIRGILGDHIYHKYILIKDHEWDLYNKEVHDWEVKKYVDLY